MYDIRDGSFGGSSSQRDGKKIAVTGKGGSGKTMLVAIMVTILSGNPQIKLLAIDADSAINLPFALGTRYNRTVSDIRREMIEDPKARQEMENKNVRIIMQEAVIGGNGFDLLVMGRPEGPGCYCPTNDLLRYGIENLSRQYDITLIDCEAGPEQVNRRIVRGVDIVLIVTDNTVRSIYAASAIADISTSDPELKVGKIGLIINRSKDNNSLIIQMAKQRKLEVIGIIPEDEILAEYDANGKPLYNLPETSPSIAEVRKILDQCPNF